MELVYGDDERQIAWAQERIGVRFRPDATAIGHARGGELAGVVVYDGFSQCDCNMHVASDGSRRWLTRTFLVHVFSYPFITVGLRRVTALVPAKNAAALQFDRKLGFRIEGRCEKALPDDDIIIMGMTRSRCPYIPPEHRHD